MGYWRFGKKLRFHKPARIASVAAADLRLMVTTIFVGDRQPSPFPQISQEHFTLSAITGPVTVRVLRL